MKQSEQLGGTSKGIMEEVAYELSLKGIDRFEKAEGRKERIPGATQLAKLEPRSLLSPSIAFSGLHPITSFEAHKLAYGVSEAGNIILILQKSKLRNVFCDWPKNSEW